MDDYLRDTVSYTKDVGAYVCHTYPRSGIERN